MKRWLLSLIALPLAALAAPERVVSLGGDISEIAWQLSGGKTLVARDSTSLSPAAITQLPDVGYLRQLNPEGILAMTPDLVLASAAAQPSLALKQVQDSGVKVVTIPVDNSLAALPVKINAVAAALGKTAEGQKLAQSAQRQIAALPTAKLPVKVLYILNHSGMSALAAGQDTAADAAIRAAGLTNAMQGFSRYQPLSQEGVIASQPDMVVISQDGLAALGGEAALWKLPGLAMTPAGRNHKLLAVDEMALLGFGLRTPHAVAALRQAAEGQP